MTPEQRKALDIGATCWVNASAGSGKTSILVARMVRLLLAGISGRAIVCLTFTKVGAMEMRERLDQKISLWATCPAEHLHHDLEIILARKPSHQDIDLARSLHKSCEKHPVIIQTFHSFCHDTLMRFPIESGLNIPLQVLDQASAVRLWDQSLDTVLRDMDPISPVGQAVQRIVDSGVRLPTLLTELFSQRLLPRPEYDKSVVDFSENDFLKSRPNPPPEPHILGDSDQKWLDQFRSVSRGSVVYCALMGTKILKKNALVHPSLQKWHQQESLLMQEVCKARDQQKKIQKEQDSALIFQATMAVYAHNKGGCLDFDDLTLKTLDLLEHTLYSGWVWHTLYQTTEHILVDEAQDTSRHQWKILRSVIEAVIQKPHRTVCVVGDPKQSIYGFQGADPEGFFLMRQFVNAWVVAQGGCFYDVSLVLSFRSSPTLLNVVNAVFSKNERTKMEFSEHTSMHQNRFGVVTLWAHTGDAALDYTNLSAAWVSTLNQFLGKPFFLPSQNRPISARDIMIILPRRTAFFKTLQDHLYRAGLLTGKDISCKDNPVLAMLVSWCRMVMDSDDDTALARILSGMSSFSKECCLFISAYQRGRRSIFQNILIKSEGGIKTSFFSAFSKYIKTTTRAKTSQRLLDLVVHWVYVDGGMAFLSALEKDGEAAQNAIDVFVGALQSWPDPDDAVGFLDWIQRADTIFKNPLRGGVQLLTIHGAKGAQSPVVILPDLPESIEKDDPEYWRLLYVAMTRAQDRLYLSSCKPTSPWYQAVHQAVMGCGAVRYQDCSDDEAEKSLSIIKYTVSDGVSDDSDQTTQGLSKSLEPKESPDVLPSEYGASTTNPDLNQEKPIHGSFTWLISGLHDNHWDETAEGTSIQDAPESNTLMYSHDMFFYRHRGESLHQLLDELPQSDPLNWHMFAWRFLCKQGLNQHQADFWAKRLVDLLHQSEFYPLFFKAKSEVEWCGPGQIRRMDRVLVGKTDVWIIDFKSDGAMVPWISMPYRDQMQRYVDLLQPIYPTKRIHQGILWLKQGVLQWHPESRCWSQHDEF